MDKNVRAAGAEPRAPESSSASDPGDGGSVAKRMGGGKPSGPAQPELEQRACFVQPNRMPWVLCNPLAAGSGSRQCTEGFVVMVLMCLDGGGDDSGPHDGWEIGE